MAALITVAAAIVAAFAVPIFADRIRPLRPMVGAQSIGPVPPPQERQDFADLREHEGGEQR